MMNVRLDHGGIDPQLRAVLEAEIDCGVDDRVIDGLKRVGGNPVEGSVKRVVFRHPLAIELGEGPQRVPVRDPFAQLAIVPVLHAHQDHRPEDAGRSSPCVPSWAA